MKLEAEVEDGYEETRTEKRLRCWESVFSKGQIEGECPVCRCSRIRYSSTSGTTFQQLHIIAERHGGSGQSWNLLPGCGCNQNMRHMNLVDWMGTRGNKRSLMRPLFLAKYKSLVAPCHRSSCAADQLIRWVSEIYRPEQMAVYRDWLILLDSDLRAIRDEECEEEKEEEKILEEKPNLSPYFSRAYAKKHYTKRNNEFGKRLRRNRISPSYGARKAL